MTKADALQKLSVLLKNIKQVQQEAGWNGLFSFFTITKKGSGQTKIIHYQRTYDDMGLGDSLNLSVSLSSVIGSLSTAALPANQLTLRDGILTNARTFLTNQDQGFSKFYDSSSERFFSNYNFTSASFNGYMDRLFNEFRVGLFLLASRKPQYLPAVQNLEIAFRS